MSGEKDNWGRADKLRSWFTEGGVLIIGRRYFFIFIRNLLCFRCSDEKHQF